VEMSLTQKALRQHREPGRTIDQNDVVILRCLGEASTNGLAKSGFMVAFRDLSLEQGKIGVAWYERDRPRIVHIGNIGNYEVAPACSCVPQHRASKVIHNGAAS